MWQGFIWSVCVFLVSTRFGDDEIRNKEFSINVCNVYLSLWNSIELYVVVCVIIYSGFVLVFLTNWTNRAWTQSHVLICFTKVARNLTKIHKIYWHWCVYVYLKKANNFELPCVELLIEFSFMYAYYWKRVSLVLVPWVSCCFSSLSIKI